MSVLAVLMSSSTFEGIPVIVSVDISRCAEFVMLGVAARFWVEGNGVVCDAG